MDDMRVSLADSHLVQQAFELSVVGTVIVDALQDDQPIVYVNPAFERMTGYEANDILGRNCRFLQGEDRDQPGIQEMQQANAQGQAVTVTLRNYRKNGALFYNEVTFSPLRDETGKVTHFVGYQQDVTRREEAAVQAARVHQQLRSTLDRITDGFMALDRNLNFTHVNAAAASFAGKRPEDLTGHNLLTTLPELADSAVVQAILRAQTTATPQSGVAHLFGWWIDASAYPTEEGVSVFIRDVTDRHQLQRSEERFSKVFQASPIAVALLRFRDGRFMDVNEAFLRQRGSPREKVIGRSLPEVGVRIDRAERDEIIRQLEEGQVVQRQEVRLRRRSGEERDTVISVVKVELDDEPCVVSLIQDITAERETQRTLKANEERYRRLAAELQRTLDLSIDLITSIDAGGRFATVSAACQQMLGYRPEELIGHSFLEFVHPDDRARTTRAVRSIGADHTTRTFRNRYLHKHGAVVWMEWVTVVSPGDPLMYCMARDITGRRAAEEDQAYLAAIVQASQDAILGVGLDGTIRSWNAGAEGLYGYSAGEAVGKPMTLIVPPELHAEEAKIHERARRGERVTPCESVRVAQDGRRIPVLVTASPILDTAGRVIGVSKISQDITDRKAAERQIQGLNQDLHQQLRHLTGLREIDQMIASSQDLSVTLDRILAHIEGQLGVDAVTLLLLNPHSLSLEYVGFRGLMAPELTRSLLGSTLRLGTGLAGEVALNRQPLSVPDLSAASLSPTWRKEGLIAYYGAPLMAKGKVLGVIETLHRNPFEPSGRWLETFGMLTGQAAIAVDNAQLFQSLEQRNLQLRLSYDETIEGWARALDLRDKETEGHSRRVTEMTVRLCQGLGLSSEELVDVRRGALLHDIGKMGIPDAVLFKPGALTDEEWVLMRRHPEYAVSLLSPIRFLRSALEIPQYHHEKWDGSGYPLGLSREAIPLTARAFAVVDVYDALTSDRPYRTAWTPERALVHIQNGAGTHFDPQIIKVFLRLLTS